MSYQELFHDFEGTTYFKPQGGIDEKGNVSLPDLLLTTPFLRSTAGRAVRLTLQPVEESLTHHLWLLLPLLGFAY